MSSSSNNSDNDHAEPGFHPWSIWDSPAISLGEIRKSAENARCPFTGQNFSLNDNFLDMKLLDDRRDQRDSQPTLGMAKTAPFQDRNHRGPPCLVKGPDVTPYPAGKDFDLNHLLSTYCKPTPPMKMSGCNRSDAKEFASRYGIDDGPKEGLFYRMRKGKYRKEF